MKAEMIWYSSVIESYWLRFVQSDAGMQPQKVNSTKASPPSSEAKWQEIPQTEWPLNGRWKTFDVEMQCRSEFRLVKNLSAGKFDLEYHQESTPLDQPKSKSSRFAQEHCLTILPNSQTDSPSSLGATSALLPQTITEDLLTTATPTLTLEQFLADDETSIVVLDPADKLGDDVAEKVPRKLLPLAQDLIQQAHDAFVKNQSTIYDEICQQYPQLIPQIHDKIHKTAEAKVKEIIKARSQEVKELAVSTIKPDSEDQKIEIPQPIIIRAGKLINRKQIINEISDVAKRLSAPGGLSRGQAIFLQDISDTQVAILAKALLAGHSPEDLQLTFINTSDTKVTVEINTLDDYHDFDRVPKPPGIMQYPKTIGFLAQAIGNKKCRPGLKIFFENIPQLFNPLFLAICSGGAPQDLTIGFKDSLYDFKFFANKLASGNGPKNLTFIIDNTTHRSYEEEDSPSYYNHYDPSMLALSQAFKSRNFPAGFKFKLIREDFDPAIRSVFHFGNYEPIIKGLAEDKNIISLQLPYVNKKSIDLLEQVLKINDSLLEFTTLITPKEMSEESREKLNCIDKSLLRNRMTHIVPLVSLLLKNHLLPDLCCIIIQYILTELGGYQCAFGTELLIEDIKPKNSIEDACQAWRIQEYPVFMGILQRHPDFSTQIWDKIIGDAIKNSPVLEAKTARLLLQAINSATLYRIEDKTTEERQAILKEVYEYIKAIIIHPNIASIIQEFTLMDYFTYQQIQALVGEDKPKMNPDILSLIKDDKCYQKKHAGKIEANLLQLAEKILVDSKEIPQCQSLFVKKYLKNHITLETLFALADIILPYIETKSIRSICLSELIDKYSTKEGPSDVRMQNIVELQALQDKMKGQTRIPILYLELLKAVHQERVGATLSFLFRPATYEALKELEKILEPPSLHR